MLFFPVASQMKASGQPHFPAALLFPVERTTGTHWSLWAWEKSLTPTGGPMPIVYAFGRYYIDWAIAAHEEKQFRYLNIAFSEFVRKANTLCALLQDRFNSLLSQILSHSPV